MAVASLIIAVVALIVALASAAYTRRQAVASEGVTAIEDQRRHDELMPELVITCEERAGSRMADMTVELTGPAGLDRLDEVTIRIRDDIPDRKPSPGSQLTQDQISEVVWGPYRFNPGQWGTGGARARPRAVPAAQARAVPRQPGAEHPAVMGRPGLAPAVRGQAGPPGDHLPSRRAWALDAPVRGRCQTRPGRPGVLALAGSAVPDAGLGGRRGEPAQILGIVPVHRHEQVLGRGCG